VIRTLLLIAAVSFVLAIGFFAGAMAIVGGPFYIDDGWHFRRTYVSDQDIDVEHRPPTVMKVSDDTR
jgi:hypothetical protein